MAIWEQPELLSGTIPQMTGADGIKPELGVYILHTGQVTIQWAMRFKLLQLPPFVYVLSSNQPYDTSREMCVRTLMNHNVKYILSIDSDTLLPVNGVQLLIEWMEQYKLDIISGLYWAKKPEIMPCAWIKTGENPAENSIQYMPLDAQKYLKEEKQTGKQDILGVDVCGAGCLLVRTDVFKKLDKSNPNLPFFQWGIGRKDKTGEPLLQVSEDFYFCNRCMTELNIRPHIAMPIRCDHIATAKRRAEDGEFELLLGLY